MENPRTNRRNQAFTLVEMLVTVAIIAIMTGIIITNLSGSKAKSRDVQRISDLAQIQVALGFYFDRCNQFPSTLDISAPCTGVADVTFGSYIPKIPPPPAGANQTAYDYLPKNTPPSDYVLHTKLEAPNPSATANGLGSTYSNSTVSPNFVCDDAPTSTDYCLGPK